MQSKFNNSKYDYNGFIFLLLIMEYHIKRARERKCDCELSNLSQIYVKKRITL